MLAVRYLDGDGVNRDASTPAWLFRQAAKGGHIHSQYNLGVLHARDVGVAQDDATAVQWFRKAADQGVDQAQFNLGVLYAEGRGISRKLVQAYMWYRRAAAQRHAEAAESLERISLAMSAAELAKARKLAQSDHRETAALVDTP